MAIFITGNTFSTKIYPVYLNGKNLLSFQTKKQKFPKYTIDKIFSPKKKKGKRQTYNCH